MLLMVMRCRVFTVATAFLALHELSTTAVLPIQYSGPLAVHLLVLDLSIIPLLPYSTLDFTHLFRLAPSALSDHVLSFFLLLAAFE